MTAESGAAATPTERRTSAVSRVVDQIRDMLRSATPAAAQRSDHDGR